MNDARGLWGALLALLVTAVPAVLGGILAAGGSGWWLVAGVFIALLGAAIGLKVYVLGVGLENHAATGPAGLWVFAFCTVFALGPAYLTVAGVPRVGVVAYVSYGQSESGKTFPVFHIDDPATGRDLGVLRNPQRRDYHIDERVSVVADPRDWLAPSGPHLWDPLTAAMGVAAVLGMLGTLMAGVRRRHRTGGTSREDPNGTLALLR